MKIVSNDNYLLLIDEKAEIKEGYIVDTVPNYESVEYCLFKDICVTKDHYMGIAYYPLTKEAKELDLPLLPPFEEEIDLDLLAVETIKGYNDLMEKENWIPLKLKYEEAKQGFKLGYKAAQSNSKQYSLEDMKKAFNAGYDLNTWEQLEIPNEERDYLNEEEYIQSLPTQQLPKYFILGKGKTIEEQIKNGYYEY